MHETTRPHFEQDVAAYVSIGRTLLKSDLSREPQPFNDTLKDLLTRDPFEARYMQYRALQDKGYAIELFDRTATEEPVAASEAIAVHVDPADRDAVDTIMVRSMSTTHLPYHFLLYGEGKDAYSQFMYPGGRGYRYALQEMSLAHPYERIGQLLTRQAVTVQALNRARQSLAHRGPAQPNPLSLDAAQRYELSRRNSVMPYTVKELYAMAAKLTDAVLASRGIARPGY